MTDCKVYERKLSPWLDGELEVKEAALVREHTERCGDCDAARRDLATTRDLLSESFTEMIESAPRAPAFLQPETPARGPGVRRWLPAALATAAALLVAAVIFTPTREAEASPRVLLNRAASLYLSRTDAELWIRFESQALEALARILGDEKEKVISGREVGRVLIGAPNYILFQETAAPKAPWTTETTLAGFNGRYLWQWDPDKGEVKKQLPRDGRLGFDAETGRFEMNGADLNLMSFFSPDFVRELLVDKDENYRLLEVTGPAAKRAGRRVLEVRRTGEHGEEIAWIQARVTIDPEQDLIEKVEVDVKAAGISILRVIIEVAEVNRGIPPEFFHWEAHVPEGTRVVTTDAEDEKDD